MVEHFRSLGQCVEIDTGQDRQSVYAIVAKALAEFTDAEIKRQPLTERAEMLLGLRPFS